MKDLTIALPLQLAVQALSGHMREEGLFRISPSIPTLKKVKAGLDAGLAPESLLRKYSGDPHLFTSLIKATF